MQYAVFSDKEMAERYTPLAQIVADRLHEKGGIKVIIAVFPYQDSWVVELLEPPVEEDIAKYGSTVPTPNQMVDTIAPVEEENG